MLPCMFCGLSNGQNESGYPTEVDHVGQRGLGQKCDDRLSIPACTRCHSYRQKNDFKGLEKVTGKEWGWADIWKQISTCVLKYIDEGRKF